MEAVKELENFTFRGFDFSRSMPRICIFVFSDWSRCPKSQVISQPHSQSYIFPIHQYQLL